jgi:hypothetical protein
MKAHRCLLHGRALDASLAFSVVLLGRVQTLGCRSRRSPSGIFGTFEVEAPAQEEIVDIFPSLQAQKT